MVVPWHSATLKVPQLKEDRTMGPHAELKISVDLRVQEVSSSPVPCPISDPRWEDAHPALVSPTARADPVLPVVSPRVWYDLLPARPTRALQ